MELRKLGRKNRIWMNNKGDVTDVMIFVIVVGILGIALLFLVFTGKVVLNGLEGTTLNDSSSVRKSFEGLETMNNTTIQTGYLIFIGFFIVGIILSSFLAGEHPIFIFLFFIFTLMAIFLSSIFGNIYGNLLDVPAFANEISDQRIFDFVYRNMPKITLGVGTLGTLIILSRIFNAPRGGGGIG